MGRIARTIELAKASWNVLKADKELILLPVMSLIATLAVAATFLLPIFLSGNGEVALEDPGVIGYLLLFVAYVTLAFITIFFNAALVHAANERMDGGDPTLGSAIRGALMRIGGILPWAIVSATVSIILRAIEERAGIVGRIVGVLGGVAWSLVTFLVIPVLVIEGIGVRDAVSRSGSLFKKTWGENVAAQVGFGILGFIAMIPAILVIALGVSMGGSLGLILLFGAIAYALAAAMVLSALNGVFQTALYRYAAGIDTGNTALGSELQTAFAPRNSPIRGFGG